MASPTRSEHGGAPVRGAGAHTGAGTHTWPGETTGTAAGVEAISAVTLATRDMERSVRFYLALGFTVHRGGADAPFTCLRAGAAHLNLTTEGAAIPRSWWGRLIFHVPDVDAYHRSVVDAGLRPDFAPRDAQWHERYFHLTDPDGHVLSFVHPIAAGPREGA